MQRKIQSFFHSTTGLILFVMEGRTTVTSKAHKAKMYAELDARVGVMEEMEAEFLLLIQIYNELEENINQNYKFDPANGKSVPVAALQKKITDVSETIGKKILKELDKPENAEAKIRVQEIMIKKMLITAIDELRDDIKNQIVSYQDESHDLEEKLVCHSVLCASLSWYLLYLLQHVPQHHDYKELDKDVVVPKLFRGN